MSRHVLAMRGEPWDGEHYCVRCLATFAYAADGYTECPLAWPWPKPRIAAFRALARRSWRRATT